MSDSNFPWELRIELEGSASLKVERKGRTVRFDPIDAPAADDIVVLTWSESQRVAATAEALQAGVHPTVVASAELGPWLDEQGATGRPTAPCTVDGVEIELMAYQPIPYAEGAELGYKVVSALSDPLGAARRLRRRARLPKSAPVVVGLRLPSGQRLVHLNLSLHRHTPADWLEQAVARFGGADWVVVGVDYGHDEAFYQQISRFEPGHLLVADLVGDDRRAMGLPTGVLTPLVDRLVADGHSAYVFPCRSSLRFE